MGAIEDTYAGASDGQASFDASDPGFQAINPPSLFNGATLFSQIIVAPAGRTVWMSGIIATDPGNRLVAGGKDEQFAQAFANVAAAMAAAGCLPGHCVRLTEYVVDYGQADLAPLKRQIVALFPAGRLPTNTIVPVPRLGRDGALVEVEATCVLPDPG